jgi:acyl-homoserine lactone acylase PvdQ
MKYLVYVISWYCLSCSLPVQADDVKRWEAQASHVTIVRDQWGVPHVYGKTDADAVFGLMYAQCEENFKKVETSYIERLGRMAEIGGKRYLYSDLLMQMLYDTSEAKSDFNKSPDWLKKLLFAFADGINFYLYKNSSVKPALLHRFEPWYPLLFTDGGYTSLQTGGLSLTDIQRLYPDVPGSPPSSFNKVSIFDRVIMGSNAFALAPSRTSSRHAMLYINPHVSFYFRTEAHMSSEEGLNAYGAVTWGQFFVYQGFNEHCGWMHTSSQADAADLYVEKIMRRGDSVYYEYEQQWRPVKQYQLNLKSREEKTITQHPCTAYRTHHGPVVGERDKKWLSFKGQNHSLNGLIQSWKRTRANNLGEFETTMQLRTNGSTNTMYADDKGNIAYWHGNFIPVRDPHVNWALPVDGTRASYEWQGLHKLEDIVQVKNPESGWLQNCNSSPFNVAGMATLDKNNYPSYMAPDGENFRSAHIIRVLPAENNVTLDKLIAFGYDRYLSMFDTILPPLFSAYHSLRRLSSVRQDLPEAINLLETWDRRSSVSSIATTLAIEWAIAIINHNYAVYSAGGYDQLHMMAAMIRNTPDTKKLELLSEVMDGLQKTYGKWKVAWGDINRFQRNVNDEPFDDDKSSLPVGLASSVFGSLASFEPVWQNTNKGYGTTGNSFVAAVEFGPKIIARSVVTGGQYFDPASRHFMDQSAMFLEGRFKDVLFYKEEILQHAEKSYHPGQ